MSPWLPPNVSGHDVAQYAAAGGLHAAFRDVDPHRRGGREEGEGEEEGLHDLCLRAKR